MKILGCSDTILKLLETYLAEEVETISAWVGVYY